MLFLTADYRRRLRFYGRFCLPFTADLFFSFPDVLFSKRAKIRAIESSSNTIVLFEDRNAD